MLFIVLLQKEMSNWFNYLFEVILVSLTAKQPISGYGSVYKLVSAVSHELFKQSVRWLDQGYAARDCGVYCDRCCGIHSPACLAGR